MALYIAVLVTVLTHTSYKGSKVLISLYALELGATPFVVGFLFATYSIFPALLAVFAGRLADRYGARRLILFGACGLMIGLLVPFVVPGLAFLFVSAVVIGLSYIFYVVAVQSLVGAIGEGAARTRNYSIFSIGVALTALLGPTSAGFAIDLVGHRATYLLLAVLPLLPIAAVAFVPRLLPDAAKRAKPQTGQRFSELWRNVPLRRALITAGIVETGLELINFVVPIYGRSIGLSASLIGIVIGCYAAAILIVRALVPRLSRLSSEERVLSVSLTLAALTCLAFPWATTFATLALLVFVLGLGLGCGSPLSLVLAYNRSPPDRSGEAIGIRHTVTKATEVMMPVLFGTLGTAIGIAPVFVAGGAVLATGAWIMRGDARALAAARPRPVRSAAGP